MNGAGLNERVTLARLDSIVADLSGAADVRLRMVQPAATKRNGSPNVIFCGGSYNPFHCGHRELLSRALKHIDGSEAIAYITLQHSLAKPVTGATYTQRLYMLMLEQQRMPWLSVALINNGFYKNWFTLLDQFHPGARNKYYCAMGADLFPRVIETTDIADLPVLFSVDWLIAERHDTGWRTRDLPEAWKPYAQKLHAVDMPQSTQEVSSSGLRDMLNARDPAVLTYIGPETFEFIKRHAIRF